MDENDSVTYYVSLDRCAAESPAGLPTAPRDWLAMRWSTRFPDLIPIDDLLARGRVMLLPDGLNDIQAGDGDTYQQLRLRKAWLRQLVTDRPGNRVVFACRAQDYSTPLATPDLLVRHVRVEPFDDDAVTEFLSRSCPDRAHEIWSALVPGLCALAYRMQARAADGGPSQVRVGVDDALAMLGHPLAEQILEAGGALGVLDEDQATGSLVFSGPLLQEYSAARMMARCPDPELVRLEWRAEHVRPALDDVMAALAPNEALPGLPPTGWQEPALLATAMADDVAGFVRAVAEVNLPLAAAMAAEASDRSPLPESVLRDLRLALVARSRAPAADPRHRMACGVALGGLEDPRYERLVGPYGPYVWPQWIHVPAGLYPIGDDEPIDWVWQRTAERGRADFGAVDPREHVRAMASELLPAWTWPSSVAGSPPSPTPTWWDGRSSRTPAARGRRAR